MAEAADDKAEGGCLRYVALIAVGLGRRKEGEGEEVEAGVYAMPREEKKEERRPH